MRALGIIHLGIDEEMDEFQPIPEERIGQMIGRNGPKLGEDRPGQGLVLGGAVRLGRIAHQCHSLHGLDPFIIGPREARR